MSRGFKILGLSVISKVLGKLFFLNMLLLVRSLIRVFMLSLFTLKWDSVDFKLSYFQHFFLKCLDWILLILLRFHSSFRFLFTQIVGHCTVTLFSLHNFFLLTPQHPRA